MDNNNEDIFYKIVGKAKEVTLTDKERQALFHAVDSFVAKNPLPTTQAVPAAEPSKAGFISTKPIQSFISFWELYGMRTGVALLAVIVLGGGTSLAAQRAMPGDLLYPIRVNVNEGIKTAFLSDSERSQYEISRVKSRVDEAQMLAAENKLSDDAQKSILAQLGDHLTSVQKNFNNVASRGDLKSVFEISQKIEDTLGDSEAIISGLAKHSVSNDVELLSIKSALEESREASMLARNNIEEQILARNVDDNDTRVLAVAKSQSAKKTLESIEKKMLVEPDGFVSGGDHARVAPMAKGMNTVDSSSALMMATMAADAASTSTENTQTADRVAEAKSLLEQGEQKLAEGKYKEAYRLFRESYEISQDIQHDASLDIEGEVH